MKPIKVLREGICFSIRMSGMFLFAYRFLFPRRPLILLYHDPSNDLFERHLRFLSTRFTFITLDRLVEALNKQKINTLPIYSCVITLDDGHKGNYHLLETIKKYSIRPTIFLCSSIIGTNRHFWWKSGIPHISKLKLLPYNIFLQELKIYAKFEPEKEYTDRQALNIDEIKEMKPYVDFGAHTRFHPILTNCTDIVCFKEIKSSREELMLLLNNNVKHFSFPNGDFTQREIEMVKKAGFESSRTIDYGTIKNSTNKFALHAVQVDDKATINVFCAELIGVNSIIKRIIKKVWNYSIE